MMQNSLKNYLIKIGKKVNSLITENNLAVWN